MGGLGLFLGKLVGSTAFMALLAGLGLTLVLSYNAAIVKAERLELVIEDTRAKLHEQAVAQALAEVAQKAAEADLTQTRLALLKAEERLTEATVRTVRHDYEDILQRRPDSFIRLSNAATNRLWSDLEATFNRGDTEVGRSGVSVPTTD